MKLLNIYLDAFAAIEERTERLRFALMLIFVFSLPYDIFYSSLTFIVLCATTLLDISVAKLKRIPKQVWLFQLIYVLGIIAYPYSFHRSDAGFLLERQLAILLFPLILPLAVRVDRQKANAALLTLALTSFVGIVYLFITMFGVIHGFKGWSFVKVVFSGVFFNHNFSKPLNIHAGYLSLYVALSIFYTITLLKDRFRPSAKVLLWTILLTFFASLFFLASRNAIIAVLIILVFVLPFYVMKQRVGYIISSVLILLLCFFVIKNVPYLRDRFSDQLISDIKPLQNGRIISYSTTEPRVERWKCAVELIKRSPVFGYGTGDEISMLKCVYMQKGLFISYLENFNAHNQYLSYLIKNGTIGLLIFAFAFFCYCRLAVRKKDFMYLAFLLLLLFGFYTENILDANKGIVFFAFFNTILGYSNLTEQGSEAAAWGRPEPTPRT